VSWKVNMYPEEKEFIDQIWSKLQQDSTGKGRYLAPIKGGVIYVDEEYYDYDEDQKKWLLFVRINSIASFYFSNGTLPIKFMNFTYAKKVPEIIIDEESTQKWGTKRTTTDGQPLSDATGLPIYLVQKTEVTYSKYKWNDKSKSFDFLGSQASDASYLANDGKPLSEKIIK
jgi:hypothetical protein